MEVGKRKTNATKLICILNKNSQTLQNGKKRNNLFITPNLRWTLKTTIIDYSESMKNENTVRDKAKVVFRSKWIFSRDLIIQQSKHST